METDQFEQTFDNCIKRHLESLLLKLITLRKHEKFPKAIYVLRVSRPSAQGENTYNLKSFIVKLSNNYIFQKN